MAVKIRKATKEDIPILEKIDKFGLQLNKYSGIDKLDKNFKEKKEHKNYYWKFIYGKKKWCYVAEENKKIVGFILFNVEKRAEYFRIKKAGYIDLLFIDKKSRGRGISRLLMQKATEVFRKEGIEYLRLSVHSDNPAHEIWKKLGFRDFRNEMWKKI